MKVDRGGQQGRREQRHNVCGKMRWFDDLAKRTRDLEHA
jgi:hypothetical protein